MRSVIELFLDYHILVAGVAVFLVYAHSAYVEYFSKKEISDDWFDQAMTRSIMRKYGPRHDGFVGSLIPQNKDISLIGTTDDGHFRKFKE
jgi:hypothetical protein